MKLSQEDMTDLVDAVLLKIPIDDIVGLVIEQTLLKMTKVMGNLMQQKATANKMNKKLYTDFPDFVNHKEVVTYVIEKNEGKDLTKSIEDIIKDSIPEIQEKIKLKNTMDTTGVQTLDNVNTVVRPETELKPITDDDNGAI